MAIKVSGTTVIDNSRNLTNIAGGLKTVNGNSVIGSGDISISTGASTDFNTVGTYTFGMRPVSNANHLHGGTYSSVYAVNRDTSAGPRYYNGTWYSQSRLTAMSGTWRHMGGAGADGYSSFSGIWVRIS